MNKINLKSVVWNEGKHYVAQCLNVDVSSFGKSRREALINLNEAVALKFYLNTVSFLSLKKVVTENLRIQNIRSSLLFRLIVARFPLAPFDQLFGKQDWTRLILKFSFIR